MVDWVKVVSAVPSPQFTVTVQGLSLPGSVKEPRVNDLLVPAVAVWLAGAVTTGATLLTVKEKLVVDVVVPSLAVIVTV